MELKYISKIDSYHPYLKNLLTNFSYISSYYQYRIPNIEEYNFYKDKISDIVIKRIWDQYLIDQRKKIKLIEKKGIGIDKNFLDSQDLMIPHLKSSELLLIQTCINNDYDYKGIISVNMGHIPYGNKVEYYDINYVTKKHQNKYIIDGYPY